MKYCVIDYETFSRCDLKKCGAHVYANDFSTHILCLGYKVVENGKPSKTRVLLEADILKLDPGLMALVKDDSVMFVAHNATFEQEVWAAQMELFGWPGIPQKRWHDTLAVAATRGLPLGLDALSRVLELPIGKDMEGHKLMMQMCKPDSKGVVDLSAAKLQRLAQYNIGDCDAQYACHAILGGLGESERANWLLSQEMNFRGIKVDIGFIKSCQNVIQQVKVPMTLRFREITGGLNPTQRDKVLNWVNGQGVALADMKKETLDRLLGVNDDPFEDGDPFEAPMPPNVFEALTLRQSLASSSIAKLQRMVDCAGPDGRVRHTMQYHGARTGRVAGRLIQIQNYPRGQIQAVKGMTPEHLAELINSRDISRIKGSWGSDIYGAVVSSLRSCVVPERGKTLVAGDYAAVEARNVLAMAGQHDKVTMMHEGIDVYCKMASRVFGRLITKADLLERHLGKGAVLGCGYGMGPIGFHNKVAPDQPVSLAQNVIEVYRKEFAPEVVKMWYKLMDAATSAVWCRAAKRYDYIGIEFERVADYLTMRLPSGRLIYYHKPEMSRSRIPGTDEDRASWSYMNYSGNLKERKPAWHGLVTADLIQGSSRDLLMNALLLCEKEGLNPIFSAHDEIVCETADSPDLALRLKHVMEDIPTWAIERQFKVTAECATMERYRK
jgi:DNA polymerase